MVSTTPRKGRRVLPASEDRPEVGVPVAGTVIDARQVTRFYATGGETVRALRGVDLRVDAGEFVAIMGPSGSGKSTLLHTLGLMDTPDEGEYHLLGQATASLSSRERARLRAAAIGFVFQAFHLVNHRRVTDNVQLPLIYQRGRRTQDRELDSRRALSWVGMEHRADAYPPTLSGGEAQRVAIARAVVHRPQLLLCDEPTGSLDSTNSERILDILRRATDDGLAVVVVTHDPAVASRADRTVRIIDGQLYADGSAR